MKNHTRKSKASGSTVAKIQEIIQGSGRYSRKALARREEAQWARYYAEQKVVLV